MIRVVKFVGIPVQDQDRALKSWTEAMGLSIELECDDLTATHAVMIAKGGQFKSPPQKTPWGSMA